MDVKDLRKVIGLRLKELRSARGWTQGEVAARARITRDFLGRAERGLREPSLFTITKLAVVFEISPVIFLTPPDERSRPMIREIEALLLPRSDAEVRWVREVVRVLVNHPPREDRVHGPAPPRRRGSPVLRR